MSTIYHTIHDIHHDLNQIRDASPKEEKS